MFLIEKPSFCCKIWRVVFKSSTWGRWSFQPCQCKVPLRIEANRVPHGVVGTYLVLVSLLSSLVYGWWEHHKQHHHHKRGTLSVIIIIVTVRCLPFTTLGQFSREPLIRFSHGGAGGGRSRCLTLASSRVIATSVKYRSGEIRFSREPGI